MLRRECELLKASICEVDICVRVPVDSAEGQGISKGHESLSRQICLPQRFSVFVESEFSLICVGVSRQPAQHAAEPNMPQKSFGQVPASMGKRKSVTVKCTVRSLKGDGWVEVQNFLRRLTYDGSGIDVFGGN